MTRAQSTPVESISHDVITGVADATGRDPSELVPLYHVVDPDALDQLFEPPGNGFGRTKGRVVFTMEGCEVTVHASGDVDVAPGIDGTDAAVD